MHKDNSTSSTPSLTPPLTEEELLSRLRLLRSRRVGVATFFRLMDEYGSAGAALDALPDVAKAAGVERYSVADPGLIHGEYQAGKHAGAHLLAFGSEDYPDHLSAIPDPPPLLWAIGDLSLLKRPLISLVGARNASSLGLRMTRKLAGDLGRDGHVVVSGLARGIDTEAHKSALPTGTIAVMAGGVDVVYPPENAVLTQEIGENGLLLSEQVMHLQPQARHFPRRNRIISGLAPALVVIEAASKSGSLITARTALDQGRDVFAVPGHPFDARASGCNMLIRDGALLVRGSQDVIDALQPPRQPAPPETPAVPPTEPKRRTLAQTAALHSEILERLGPAPVAEDQLIRDLGQNASDVAPILVNLELEGHIERQAGGLLAKRA